MRYFTTSILGYLLFQLPQPEGHRQFLHFKTNIKILENSFEKKMEKISLKHFDIPFFIEIGNYGDFHLKIQVHDRKDAD